MAEDKILEAMKKGIESGDIAALSTIMKYAIDGAERNKFCSCVYPQLHDEDILCASCFLINLYQVRKRPQYKQGFHTAWPDVTFKKVCHICCHHVDHPVHTREQRSF